MDECTSRIYICDSDTATCVNTIGSYKCSCNYGYDKVLKTCITAPGKRYAEKTYV